MSIKGDNILKMVPSSEVKSDVMYWSKDLQWSVSFFKAHSFLCFRSLGTGKYSPFWPCRASDRSLLNSGWIFGLPLKLHVRYYASVNMFVHSLPLKKQGLKRTFWSPLQWALLIGALVWPWQTLKRLQGGDLPERRSQKKECLKKNFIVFNSSSRSHFYSDQCCLGIRGTLICQEIFSCLSFSYVDISWRYFVQS